MPPELIYAYIGSDWRIYPPWRDGWGTWIAHLVGQGVTGVFWLESTMDAQVEKMAQEFTERGLDLILAYGEFPPDSYTLGLRGQKVDEAPPDLDRLRRAKRLTRKLALGSSRNGEEWGGRRNDVDLAYRYQAMAREFDFEWVCTLGFAELMNDIRDHLLRDVLGQTLCVSLCAYILAGLIHEVDVPFLRLIRENPKYKGADLSTEYALTAERLAAHVGPMRVVSGVGAQPGLNAGTRWYLRELGFDGIVVGSPFDLAGTEKQPHVACTG